MREHEVAFAIRNVPYAQVSCGPNGDVIGQIQVLECVSYRQNYGRRINIVDRADESIASKCLRAVNAFIG